MFSVYHRYSFICHLNSNGRSLLFSKSLRDGYVGADGDNEIDAIYIFFPPNLCLNSSVASTGADHMGL